jgi:hypothetical protein
LSWGTALFFLAHSLTAHKELRFLMNILIPSIFLMIYGFSPKYHDNSITDNTLFARIWKYRFSLPAKLFYAFNILALLSFFLYQNGQAILAEKYLYHQITKPTTIYTVKHSLYAPWGINTIQQDFYKPDGVQITVVDSLNDIPVDAQTKDTFYIVSRGLNDTPIPTQQLPKDLLVEKIHIINPNVYTSIKGKIKNLLHYKETYYPAIWTVYHVRIRQ